jgi:hypothetical protein
MNKMQAIFNAAKKATPCSGKFIFTKFFLFILHYKYSNNLYLSKISWHERICEIESRFKIVYFFLIHPVYGLCDFGKSRTLSLSYEVYILVSIIPYGFNKTTGFNKTSRGLHTGFNNHIVVFLVYTNYHISVHGLSCSLSGSRLVLWSQYYEVMRKVLFSFLGIELYYYICFQLADNRPNVGCVYMLYSKDF